MKTHRFAEAIPEMTQGEYLELKDDLKANGQRVPIVLFKGAILDGRNRFRAMKELRKDPKLVEFKGTDVDAASLVISLNIKRRHLTVGQRSAIGIETLLPAMKEQAKERKKSAGGARIASKTNEPKNRLTAPKKATAQVAKAVGVSRAAVEQAVRVQEKATPEVRRAVKEGKMSLGAAVKTLDPPAKPGGRTKAEEIAYTLSLWVLKKQSYPLFAKIARLYISFPKKDRQEMKSAFEKFFTELDRFEEGSYNE